MFVETLVGAFKKKPFAIVAPIGINIAGNIIYF
jgi:hypothetical protein